MLQTELLKLGTKIHSLLDSEHAQNCSYHGYLIKSYHLFHLHSPGSPGLIRNGARSQKADAMRMKTQNLHWVNSVLVVLTEWLPVLWLFQMGCRQAVLLALVLVALYVAAEARYLPTRSQDDRLDRLRELLRDVSNDCRRLSLRATMLRLDMQKLQLFDGRRRHYGLVRK
jgi:hypothetical protein